jgi:hypothetical protein
MEAWCKQRSRILEEQVKANKYSAKVSDWVKLYELLNRYINATSLWFFCWFSLENPKLFISSVVKERVLYVIVGCSISVYDFTCFSSANLMLLFYLKTSLSYPHASRFPNHVFAGAGSVHRFAM